MSTDECYPRKFPFIVNEPKPAPVPFGQSDDFGTIKVQFLYRDGENYVMMNSENFDLIVVPPAQVVSPEFLKEGLENISILFWCGRLIELCLPAVVELKVNSVCRPPGAGSAFVTTAVLETGAEVEVPPGICAGQTIRIDTRTGCYSPLES